MKQIAILLLITCMVIPTFSSAQNMSDPETIYQFEMTSLQGESVSLEEYKGKVVLLVNVASKCGLTPQYEDLQATYTKYKDEGLVILGFPANNFAWQEPGSDQEIEQFCTKNYGVDFPMFSKISVKGKDQHPLYQFLTQKEKNGVLDAKMKWNFQKFLVGKDGKLISVIDPRTKVTEEEVVTEIEGLLNADAPD